MPRGALVPGVKKKAAGNYVFLMAMKWRARRPGLIPLHLPEGTEFMPLFLFLSSLFVFM